VGLEVLGLDKFFFGHLIDLNSFQTSQTTNIHTTKYQKDHSDGLSGVLKKVWGVAV
jgi:hypothetical protein